MPDFAKGLKFHPGLKCHPLRLAYSFSAHTLTLFLAPYECCDMQGAIDLALAIDPHAHTIRTNSGPYDDTSYHLMDTGQWWAQAPHEPFPTSNPDDIQPARMVATMPPVAPA
jgi:hypothetical protein